VHSLRPHRSSSHVPESHLLPRWQHRPAANGQLPTLACFSAGAIIDAVAHPWRRSCHHFSEVSRIASLCLPGAPRPCNLVDATFLGNSASRALIVTVIIHHMKTQAQHCANRCNGFFLIVFRYATMHTRYLPTATSTAVRPRTLQLIQIHPSSAVEATHAFFGKQLAVLSAPERHPTFSRTTPRAPVERNSVHYSCFTPISAPSTKAACDGCNPSILDRRCPAAITAVQRRHRPQPLRSA